MIFYLSRFAINPLDNMGCCNTLQHIWSRKRTGNREGKRIPLNEVYTCWIYVTPTIREAGWEQHPNSMIGEMFSKRLTYKMLVWV